jgi:hypothetical protein
MSSVFDDLSSDDDDTEREFQEKRVDSTGIDIAQLLVAASA